MKNLKTIRKKRGITQGELAHQAGCTQTHVSDIENGIHAPSIALAEKFADILKVSIDQLLDRTSTTNQQVTPEDGWNVPPQVVSEEVECTPAGSL